MSTNRSSVRIIGGEHRSRRLKFTDQNGDLRPSTDRLRETLFNWIQFDLGGRQVLDLFAGSGILAAEALSRGADRAELIDIKPKRADDLKQELKPLFGTRIKVHAKDALKWLDHPADRCFDLIFIDPPYHLHVITEACQLLEQHGWLLDRALIYIETSAHDPEQAVPAHWQLLREKVIGDASARLYTVTR